MNIAVIICSAHRPSILAATAASLCKQTLPPAQLLICVPSACSAPESISQAAEVIIGRAGLTKQRNDALDRLQTDIDLLLFLDDDVELAEDYLQAMGEAFSENTRIAIASGRMLADGVRGKREISREAARSILAARDQQKGFVQIESAYGCNMAIRGDLALRFRFDERLPLYAYL